MYKTRTPIVVLAYVICIAIFSSCEDKINSNIEIIEIDPESARVVNLSSFVKGIKYIKLGLSSDIVLGPGSIVIDDSHIFYYDFLARTIYLFDHTGYLINSLDKSGEGSGEYRTVSAFDVDPVEKILEVFDVRSMNVLKYSYPSFKFISQRKISSLVHMETGLKLDKDKYLVSTEGYQNIFDDIETNAEFLLYDGNLVSKLFFDRKYKDENHKEYLHYALFMNKIVRNNSNEIFVSVNFDNKIYKYENEEFNPVLEISYSDKTGIDNNKLLRMSRKEQFEYFYRSHDFVNLASFPHLSINNSNILVVNYLFSKNERLRYQDSFRHYIVVKDEDMKKTFNASSIVNDLTSFPQKIYISTFDTYNSDFIYSPWYDKYLVSVLFPASELEYNQSIVLNSGDSIKFDGNPLILLMELK